MNIDTLGWVLIAAAAWIGVGVLAWALFRRVVRVHDLEVEAEVRQAMAGIDDELAQLLGGAR